MSSIESSFSEAGETDDAGNGNFSDTGQVPADNAAFVLLGH